MRTDGWRERSGSEHLAATQHLGPGRKAEICTRGRGDAMGNAPASRKPGHWTQHKLTPHVLTPGTEGSGVLLSANRAPTYKNKEIGL